MVLNIIIIVIKIFSKKMVVEKKDLKNIMLIFIINIDYNIKI